MQGLFGKGLKKAIIMKFWKSYNSRRLNLLEEKK